MDINIKNKLKNLNIEDIIWIIYFFLALASLLSNQFERDSIINNNSYSKKKVKQINVTIFTITFFIYLYFVYINYRDVKDLKNTINNQNNNAALLSEARLIAAILFLIGGTIYLFTEQSKNENEIGFI